MGDIYIPRDESDTTNDVLGNPLAYTGKRPNDAGLINSSCITADGTLYVAAAHLVGSETVARSGGTSTPSISAGRIDFTAGTCWDLLLSDGTHYPLAEGWGVDVGSSVSDNDGVITNGVLANVWAATQDAYHFNILDGFSLYEHASTAAIRWPFKNGVAKSFTPPTGYTLTAECPFIDGFRNRAETEFDYNPDSTPEMINIYLESVFDGSTSNGYASNDSLMNFTDNLTVTCWAKSDLTNITSSADNLVSLYENTGNLQVWRMEVSTAEKLAFHIGNAGGTSTTIETADSAYPIDTWTHYAATFDGGIVKLYVNGELQGSSASSAHAATLNGRSAPIVLGSFYWTGGGGSQQEWDGSLRNIRIYKGDSRPMDSSEISKDLYETDYQPRFEGQTVIASYDVVKDTIDRSGNGFHARNTAISFTKKTLPATMGFGDNLGEDGIISKTVKFEDNEWGAVFDGSSEIVIGNREKLKINANPFEIECALKTSSAGSNTILSKYQTSGNLRSYSLNVESGKVVFHSSSNGTAVTSATGSIDVDDGSWHRIKVQKESESGTSLKMFVDGTEDGTVGGSVSANLSANISNVAIGAYNTDATSANVFTGTLRDLSVKNNGIEVAHWELAKDARDSTPNEYHGTNTGVTFLAPQQESSITVLDRYPLGKTSQFLKQYNKSRLYENY